MENAGSSILAEKDEIKVKADTFGVRSSLDSCAAITLTPDSFLLGECDTHFGTMKADILTQLACPEGYKYPSEMINANAAAIVELKKVDEQLKKDIEDVDKKVQTLEKTLKEFYATKEDLTTEKMRLNELYQHVTDIKHDVANEFQGVLATLETLTAKLEGLSVDVEALMSRIQSLVYVPVFDENKAP